MATWIISKCHRSLVSFPSQFLPISELNLTDGRECSLERSPRGTCARIAVNETIQFYYFASSLQQEVITECRRGPMGQFSMGIEKGFYLAPLLPHSQVKTRFELNRRRTARFPFLFFQIERCPLEVHRSRCYNCACEQRGKYYAPKL